MADPKLQRVRGTQDLYGPELARFDHVVETFNRVRRLYGFRRVEVPVFEATGVFARSLGETTDVVTKEMYTFIDKGNESVTLRPEFTAGIARAYISNGWQQHAPMKLATHGPAFRYERPQKGRFRQFHQLDAEIIGAGEPAADVELIAFGAQLLDELGVAQSCVLKLNTLGDAESREAWRTGLVSYFHDYFHELSFESMQRMVKNPLRILDSKAEQDIPIVAGAPTIDQFLTRESADYFAKVTSGLDEMGVRWERENRLVRGLDYYRHTAFEFITGDLGSQGTVLGGGRYDGLIEAMGGLRTPAVGWAAGIERLAMLVEEPEAETPTFAIVVENEEVRELGAWLAAALRRRGLSVEFALQASLKKQYPAALKSGAVAAFILDSNFLAPGRVANLRCKEIKVGSGLDRSVYSLAAEAFEPRFKPVEAIDLLAGREIGLAPAQ